MTTPGRPAAEGPRLLDRGPEPRPALDLERQRATGERPGGGGGRQEAGDPRGGAVPEGGVRRGAQELRPEGVGVRVQIGVRLRGAGEHGQQRGGADREEQGGAGGGLSPGGLVGGIVGKVRLCGSLRLYDVV